MLLDPVGAALPSSEHQRHEFSPRAGHYLESFGEQIG
jgi:hypothetical protein